jgi:hypothetical protein
MNEYGGQSDLGWMGSHTFQALYYGDIYPTTPVQGFPYSSFPYPYQSYNQASGMPTPQWGFPSCEDWWSDSQYGIEAQMVNLASQHQTNDPHLGSESLMDKVSDWLNATQSPVSGSQVAPNDVIAYQMLYGKGQSSFAQQGFSNYVDDNGIDGGINDKSDDAFLPMAHGLASLVADIGQDVHAAENASLMRVEIQHEIEIMQAVLLALLLSIGPLVMLAGNIRMGVIFTYFFLIGSVIFMAFVETLIHYLEMSIYAGTGMTNTLTGLTSQYAYVYNVFTQLYLWAPFIYLAIMSWCGVALGGGFQGLVASTTGTERAGAGFKSGVGKMAAVKDFIQKRSASK